ncbi:hypothetical protein JVU11DRAFT_4691 [Chiua virens]|nr:hypothetical protein JVU11DRAFT_4691 [Chiua virens]
MKHLSRFSRKKSLLDVQTRGEPSSTNQSSMALAVWWDYGINTLEATIQLIQQVTELIPIDMAKNVLTGITSILLLVQNNIKNKVNLRELAQICEDISSTLAQATKGVPADDMSDALKAALRTLRLSIDRLHSIVLDILQFGRIRRFVGATLDQKKISGWTAELERIHTSFSTKVNIVSPVRLDRMYHVLMHSEIQTVIPEPPPPPPVFFFGRERLLAKVKDALFSYEDVALIGPGGIGKSSIAKALINDDDIQRHWGRRFFVSYDDLDPTTMTPGSFIDRIAGVLGLPTLGVESKNQLISNLISSPVLIVLDNAETFEDVANADAAESIAAIVSHIANTPGVTVMLISRTSLSARDADWTEIDTPPLEKPPARQYFRKMYHGDLADGDLDKLLDALGCHPLSIHMLAHTARENRWTGKELLDQWKAQQSKLLQTGYRTGYRKENLGFTIRLSLNSPSVLGLGDDALNILGVIAFFPQGINLNHIEQLFPTIPKISSLVGTLLKMSLVHRSGIFVTTLAPVRLFLLDVFPAAGLMLLVNIRRTYYGSLKAVSREKDSHANLVMSDHLNMEHLIKYDIGNSPEVIRDATSRACRDFLDGLRFHKLRPTSLTPIILSLSEESHAEKDTKARCLFALGELYYQLTYNGYAVAAHLAARTLFDAVENHNMVALSTSNAAVYNGNQGYYSRALQLLKEFVHSPSWQYISDEDKADIHFTFDTARMFTSHEGADELFIRSMDHWYRGPASLVNHWKAKMCHGYTTPEEVSRNLELLRSRCMSSPNRWDRFRFLEVMAEAAFLEQKFDVAMDLLNQAHDAVSGDCLLTLVVLYHQAAVASVQGDYDLARSLLQQGFDMLSVVSTTSSTVLLDMRSVRGLTELRAENYSQARQLLANVAADCDMQGHITIKMLCTRALGELEIFLGRKAESDCYFEQTVELCKEAGVPPRLLCICTPMFTLDDKYSGWKMFLRGRDER